MIFPTRAGEPMPKHSRYQDYVIADGKLVGDFEAMYRDHADPWEQSTRETWASEKAVAINLLARLASDHDARKVVELGCGLGHFSARVSRLGLDVAGVDISPTAVEKARKAYPHVHFVAADIADHDVIKALRPDVIVMAEITWYVLEKLRPFLDFMKAYLPDCYVLHLLNFYPTGEQRYGRDYFTDLPSCLEWFGLGYMESGQVHRPDGMTRSWFLGR